MATENWDDEYGMCDRAKAVEAFGEGSVSSAEQVYKAMMNNRICKHNDQPFQSCYCWYCGIRFREFNELTKEEIGKPERLMRKALLELSKEALVDIVLAYYDEEKVNGK